MSSRSQGKVCVKCGRALYNANVSGICAKCFRINMSTQGGIITAPLVPPAPTTPEERVDIDREVGKLKQQLSESQTKYVAALTKLETQDSMLGWIKSIQEGVDKTYTIQPRHGSGTSEVTPIVLASDWHSEEIVKASQVSGLNEFNLEIFSQRATTFWQSTLRLIRMFNQDVTINTVVLGLLGDFITNDIHDAENAENNALLPIDAIVNVQNHIIAGMDFMLNNTTYEYVVVCKVGNHSRTTKKTRAASEMGHSLESLMYIHLAAYYRGEPRVKFVIDDAYHTYLEIYNKTARFHHGHAIQYQGGVGGIYIPGKKAIAQWNKGRKADRDFFGHFHQHLDDNMFTLNGSLIGYNAFALRIKADFEEPKQALVLVDKKRGFTGKWPVLVQ